MAHDREPQLTVSTNTQHTGSGSTLSRRTLLKYAAMSALVGVTGGGSLSESVTATGHSRGSNSPNATPSNVSDCEQGSEKSLWVKGLGSELNHYHLETSGSIAQSEVPDEQHRSTNDTVVEGTVRKDDFDLYCFTGEVTTVWARGSVTYCVNDLEDEL